MSGYLARFLAYIRVFAKSVEQFLYKLDKTKEKDLEFKYRVSLGFMLSNLVSSSWISSLIPYIMKKVLILIDNAILFN